MDLEKLLFKYSKIRLKSPKLEGQSKFLQSLEPYNSWGTSPKQIISEKENFVKK